ncbi:MAG TPA: haloalkane dehalogenase [Acidimicrobiales bacterium]|nr:haloalkane dehalogenase [Acidimicrobiales bacterium]
MWTAAGHRARPDDPGLPWETEATTAEEGGQAVDVVRTPEARFADLPGYPYPPCYVDVGSKETGPLRMHYVEAGPPDADPVLLLHGQPTWSYLYRQVIDTLAAAGHWVIAPDLIGFGRSDKPTDRLDYTVARHIDWTRRLVAALDLERTTLVVQDWGGPIGLAVLAAEPGRFARVVASNTILHTSEPQLDGRLGWANHGTRGDRVVLQEALVDYVSFTQRALSLRASDFVAFATSRDVERPVLDAYDAPFPDAGYQAGLRQFPSLIPLTRNDPGAAVNRATWTALGQFPRPFLTAFSDGDEASAGWAEIFQERVPGAQGQPHTTVVGAGHFVQEDKGTELGEIVARFISSTAS